MTPEEIKADCIEWLNTLHSNLDPLGSQDNFMLQTIKDIVQTSGGIIAYITGLDADCYHGGVRVRTYESRAEAASSIVLEMGLEDTIDDIGNKTTDELIAHIESETGGEFWTDED